MVRSMWLFKHKFQADGTLNRYKACLVANGSSQQLGVDFDETFSPVVKPATINGDLSETFYMHQPLGFIDTRQGYQVAYLLLYVDDIILIASYTILLQHLIGSLHHEFDMTDLRAFNYFLGISNARHSTGGIFLLAIVLFLLVLARSEGRVAVFFGDNEAIL
ncbi:ribonuclease H-like domain-containing protein [Tanacetum coccineum]